MINMSYWIRLTDRVEYPFVLTHLLHSIAEFPLEIPLDQYPFLVDKALFITLQNTDPDTVIPSAISISQIINFLCDEKNTLVLNQIMLVIEKHGIGNIYPLINVQEISSGIFPLIMSLLLLDFSYRFGFETDFNPIQRSEMCQFLFVSPEMFSEIEKVLWNQQNFTDEYLNNILQFLIKVAERYHDIPVNILNMVIQMAKDKSFTFKCHTAVLVSLVIDDIIDRKEFDDFEFFEMLVDLIIGNANEIMDRLLECFCSLVGIPGGPYGNYLITKMDVNGFFQALEEIRETMGSEEIDELAADAEKLIRDELPRPYEMVYSEEY
ncbi:hypothetical protein GPJ56_000291 [Histomonas meleagridis]|uniref:uncharacterized protein n=1 Tax=Histomonas meleagridis TaxID=135588 RepID=UPI00355982C6|nr:hypothetical protein GPJ56_000291 [Histomonas meleagridis]KAH0806809.1 hypothetical protein GO595_000452 [Histomonas meleagridis]